MVAYSALLARACTSPSVMPLQLSLFPLAFASSSFLPSIPDISHDLRTSESVVNYTVAVYLVVIGVACVFGLVFVNISKCHF